MNNNGNISYNLRSENKYRICYSGGCGRYEDRKSVFIADVAPVHNESESAAFLEGIRKKYWDANHHCYAYVIGPCDGGPEIKKFSDDGEPSQTAGKPMLDVIEGMGLHDVIVVVTRYFGGTLLGTGGLVRAYQGACKDGLANSVITERHDGIVLNYTIDYDFYNRVQKMAQTEPIHLLSSDFSDVVKISIAVDKSDSLNIINKVEEMSAARAKLTDTEEIYFIIVDGKVLRL